MFKYIIILFYFIDAYANASNFSLLLTKDEYANHSSITAPVCENHNVIKLNAIMYLGPNNWCIWMNNNKITPHESPEHIRIKQVTHEKVAITWIDEDGEQDFDLSVNEFVELKKANP